MEDILISNMTIGTYRCHVWFFKRRRQPEYGGGKGLYKILIMEVASAAKPSCARVAAYTRELSPLFSPSPVDSEVNRKREVTHDTN